MQSGILQGFNSIVYARFLDLVVLPSALLIAISFSVFVGGSKLAPDGAMASYGAAFAASILVGGIFVASTARAGPAGGATEKEPHTWYRLSLPMMASEVTQTIMAQASLIILPILVSTAEVGEFRVALAASGFVLLPSAAAMAPIPAAAAHHLPRNQQRDLQKVVSLCIGTSVLTMGLLATALCIHGDVMLVYLYGDEFGGAFSSMVILIIGQVFVIFGVPAAWLLRASGNQLAEARVTALCGTGQIALTLAVTPFVGVAGAAAAYAVARSARALVLQRIALKRTGISCINLRLWRKR